MTTYRIVHTTRYVFDRDVASCEVEARLQPPNLYHQEGCFHQIVARPLIDRRREWGDKFGNRVSGLTVGRKLRTLEVTAINVVRTLPRAGQESLGSMPWEDVRRIAHEDGEDGELAPFLEDSPLAGPDPAIADYALVSFTPGRQVIAATRDLVRRIHEDFAYVPGATDVQTTAAEAFRLRLGVCQDFAHIGIAGLRALGLPARYVSGYMDTSQSKGAQVRPGEDASHAWLSVYVPGTGWIDFDPTNDRAANETYVILAWGRDYGDIVPLQGLAEGGGGHKFSVSVDMRRDEPARAAHG